MKDVQVALYARVSSEQQAEAKTIDSQLAEIRVRIADDGFDLTNILDFIDDGYSGATLVRPALERLRDVAHREEWIGFTCIVLIASRATMRIKCCYLMS
jgi:site-specific DNA recombinase